VTDTLELPAPVRAALAAANANDMEAFLDCFSEDAVVGDWGWEFQGRDQIRAWSDREFIGRKVSLEVTAVEGRNGRTVIGVEVGGEGFNGPSRLKFQIEGDKVTRMTVRI
jgi:ketosteroid isomerase-like protein